MLRKIAVRVCLVTACLAVVPLPAQVINTAAGNGNPGFAGDGGPARSAQIDTATGVAVDRQGNVYLADTRNHRIRKVAGEVITTIAGKGTEGFSGDGGPATAAELCFPRGVAVDGDGNVYVADTGNNRIRMITPRGVISTFAGGATGGFAGDGGPATRAQLSSPHGLAFDSQGNLYVADTWNFRVRQIAPDGSIRTYAGNGSNGPYGDGGPAVEASLGAVETLACDAAGNLYIADPYNHRIRAVSSAGIISTVAGADFGPAVDGGAARAAALRFPKGVVADAQGNVYLSDSLNHRVRKISTAGTISTVAGSGTAGYAGDGGPATSGQLNQPGGLSVDPSGRLLIADVWNARVRAAGLGLVQIPPPALPAVTVITSVAHAASGEAVVSSGAYLSIYGNNLAPETRDWSGAIANGKLPTSLGGVSVTIGGVPAYVNYISPGQINVMASNVQAGKVDVKVMNNGALSAPFPVTAKSRAPAFFLWQGKYAVATHLDGTWCAKSGLFPGYPTTPAKPGEWIVFWGSGFAPTDLGAGGLTPAGQVISVRPVYAWVGTRGAEAYDQAAALAPGFAGLFQVAIQIPATTPDGDAMVRASSGASDWTPDGVFVTVRR